MPDLHSFEFDLPARQFSLCGYVTGIKERRRKLYTDNETIDYDICQPIILNGIHDVIKNEDILNRSIVLTLEKPANGENVADGNVKIPSTANRLSREINNCCRKDDFQWAEVVLKIFLKFRVYFKSCPYLWRLIRTFD